MHKKIVLNKLQKIANLFDQCQHHNQADQITQVMHKIAQIGSAGIYKPKGSSFLSSQPDLAIIEKKNNIPNDLLYYAASVTQRTKTPKYNEENFEKTLAKLNSIKNNPRVKDNFPNISNNVDSAIDLLNSKSNQSGEIETKSTYTERLPSSKLGDYASPADKTFKTQDTTLDNLGQFLDPIQNPLLQMGGGTVEFFENDPKEKTLDFVKNQFNQASSNKSKRQASILMMAIKLKEDLEDGVKALFNYYDERTLMKLLKESNIIEQNGDITARPFDYSELIQKLSQLEPTSPPDMQTTSGNNSYGSLEEVKQNLLSTVETIDKFQVSISHAHDVQREQQKKLNDLQGDTISDE